MRGEGVHLVTGARGFVGLHLCRALQARGIRVRALLREPTPGPWDEQVIVDLEAQEWPVGVTDGVAVIHHLAAKVHALSERPGDGSGYDRLNVGATRRLIETGAASGVRAVVYLSSVKAMGEGGDAVLDERAQIPPETPYGRSKREAEALVLGENGLPHATVLRPAMVYGPGGRGNLPRMIQAIERGIFPPLPHTGARRSMLHVADLIEAILLAMDHPEANRQVFLVTDGQCYETRRIQDWIRAALGGNPWKKSLPLPVWRLAALAGDLIGKVIRRRFPIDSDALEKLIGPALYDSSSIEMALGFKPKRDLERSLPEIMAELRGK